MDRSKYLSEKSGPSRTGREYVKNSQPPPKPRRRSSWPILHGRIPCRKSSRAQTISFGVVRYGEWSSDVAQAEFMSATKSSASDPNDSGETPIQLIKAQTGCDR